MRSALILGALSLWLGAGLASAGQGELFVPRSVQTDGNVASRIGVVRERAVDVDRAVLDAPAVVSAQPGQGLVLNLFDDVVLRAGALRAERTSRGTTWVGRIEGQPLGNVVLSEVDGVLVGSVVSPLGAFRIRYTGAGHVIEEIDQSAYPEHGCVVEPPAIGAPASGASSGPASALADGAITQADDGSTIDLLVVYTPAARVRAGGTAAAINARIQLGVTETNQGYLNSGVIQRLRLVGTQEVSYTEAGTDTTGMSTDLNRLTTAGDGFVDSVQSLRDTLKADVVSMIVSGYSSSLCGIAWLMNGNNSTFAPNAFSVVDEDCISPNYSFGHEIGHNMGLNHARADPTGSGAYSYSFGYKDPGNAFRTVMAYNCPVNCPRILYFSNPNVSYSTKPTGIIDTAPDSAFNALSLNNTRVTVANWRVADTLPAGLVNRYRLFSDVTKEHHYTTDVNEYAVLGTRGWLQEGVAHKIYTSTTQVSGITPTALYRLYHPGIQQHLWTTDANEYAVLGTRGWTQEGIDGYILPSAVVGTTTPLFRLAYAFLPIHLWTTDANEYSVLATRGWIQEGSIGQVVP